MSADSAHVVDVLQAVDKGPISETHILVLAVEHYPNTMTLQPGAFAEVHKLVAALRKAYASRDLHLVGFERHAVVQSCSSCLSVSTI